SNRAQYVLYIVVNALKNSKRAMIFRYNPALSKRDKLVWANDVGDQLKIEERTGARLSIA
ncbi:MAG: hypothetical protein AAGE86_05240, partial [Pseudomonadota bacterium]